MDRGTADASKYEQRCPSLEPQNAETYTLLEVTFQMRTEIIVSTNMREQ